MSLTLSGDILMELEVTTDPLRVIFFSYILISFLFSGIFESNERVIWTPNAIQAGTHCTTVTSSCRHACSFVKSIRIAFSSEQFLRHDGLGRHGIVTHCQTTDEEGEDTLIIHLFRRLLFFLLLFLFGLSLRLCTRTCPQEQRRNWSYLPDTSLHSS
jgi:hypothetical protein